MEENYKKQLLNLYAFVNMYLVPAWRRMGDWTAALGGAELTEEISNSRFAALPKGRQNQLRFGGQYNHSKLALWEGYLWLHLGVELKYFPQLETAELITSPDAMFPEYYSSYAAIGDLVPGRLHLALRNAFGR